LVSHFFLRAARLSDDHCMIPAPVNASESELVGIVSEDREPSVFDRLEDATVEHPAISPLIGYLGSLLAPQAQGADPREDYLIEGSFEDAVDAIEDEQLAQVIEIPAPLEPPTGFAAIVLNYLQRLLPEPRSENEVRIYLWYEWQARILQASVPLIGLLPFEQREGLLTSIFAIIDDARPW